MYVYSSSHHPSTSTQNITLSRGPYLTKSWVTRMHASLKLNGILKVHAFRCIYYGKKKLKINTEHSNTEARVFRGSVLTSTAYMKSIKIG